MKTIAVIGAGKVGSGLASASALAGYRTILEDVLPSSLRRAKEQIHSQLERDIQQGKLSANEADSVLKRVEFAGSVAESVRDADVVFEALPSDLESKIEILTQLDIFCPPHTILVSNLTSLNITELASVTYRAPKCVGVRFADPVSEMTMVEIVRSAETADETIHAVGAVVNRMGMKIVVLEDRTVTVQ